MWAKNDNGNNVNWHQATDYCRILQLAGHSDSRLATIEALEGMYDARIDVPGQYIGVYPFTYQKGNVQLSGWEWSSSQGAAFGEAWDFSFPNGKRTSIPLGYSDTKRALCVRHSGE